MPTVRHPKYCDCLKTTLITPEDSPRILQERIIENLDGRFHQHILCFTCEKAVWQSGIIVGDLKELQDQADVALPRWQGGMDVDSWKRVSMTYHYQTDESWKRPSIITRMRIRCLARFEKVAICAPCIVPDSKTEIYQQAQGQPQTQRLSRRTTTRLKIRKLDWYFRYRLKQANTMAGSGRIVEEWGFGHATRTAVRKSTAPRGGYV